MTWREFVDALIDALTSAELVLWCGLTLCGLVFVWLVLRGDDD